MAENSRGFARDLFLRPIGVLRAQCLDRRIEARAILVSEIEAWERQRNASGARVKWSFTTQKARSKLARAYPDTAKES